MKKKSRFVAMTITILIAGTAIISGCEKDEENPPAAIITVDGNGNTTINNTLLSQQINALPQEALSQDERESIVFMREEEKMARDLNIFFYQKWGQKIFDNISAAEQTHMDAILLLINKYSLTDPVGTNPAGVFSNSTLQTFYNTFLAQGNISLTEALKVGAAVEELDIRDLNNLLNDDDINNRDIELVYTNLVKASRNHLRSFVKVLLQRGITYIPQYLTQSEYDTIINSPMETGN